MLLAKLLMRESRTHAKHAKSTSFLLQQLIASILEGDTLKKIKLRKNKNYKELRNIKTFKKSDVCDIRSNQIFIFKIEGIGEKVFKTGGTFLKPSLTNISSKLLSLTSPM